MSALEQEAALAYTSGRRRPAVLATPGRAVTTMAAGLFVWLASAAFAAPRPSIFPDELVYTQLQQTVAQGEHFAVLGRHFSPWSYGVLYPLLLSPLARLGAAPLTLYRLDQLVSCVLMTSAVVPAYLLARRLCSEQLALFATALVVGVPSTIYATHAMTESLGYPLFLWTLLAAWRTLAEPTPPRFLAVLCLIALTVLTRAELIVLAPAYACAWLVLRRGRRGLVVAVALATAALLLLQLRLPVVSAAIGGHRALVPHLQLAAAPRWALFNLGGLELYVGVLPLCAAAIVLPRWLAGNDGSLRAFAALALCLGFWLLALIGTYVTQNPHSGVYDRYTFYLAPLAFLAFARWLQDGAPRPRRTAVAVGIAAAILPFLLPYNVLFGDDWGVAVNLGLLPLYLARQVAGVVALYAPLGAGLAIAAVVFVRTRLERRQTAMMLVLAAVALTTLTARLADGAEVAIARTCVGDAAWVSKQPEAAGRIVVIASRSGTDSRCALLESLFANRRTSAVYSLGDPLLRGLPEQRLRLDGRGVLRLLSGRPLVAAYAVSDRPLTGTRLARERNGLGLYRLPAGPVRVVTARSRPSPRPD